MKEVVRKEILFDLSKTIEILKVKEVKDIQELEKLSDHAIDDVALHKDLDLISITVLIYSIYKVIDCFTDKNYHDIVAELQSAKENLHRSEFGKYNQNIKQLFSLVRSCDAKIKIHFQNVMDAARIKKGTALLERGLSIGQAAGLMGLSNWDLQVYAGKRVSFIDYSETIPAKNRLTNAFKIFSIS
ncbi:MAG: hypothetical protein Q8R37_04380 [Nanoarchaeota archaeon]|nr:hypothetical protein [Nanoarchaeota archaeon]